MKLNLKKFLIPLIVVVVFLGLYFFKSSNLDKPSNIPQNQQTGYEARVTLQIDYGNKTVKSFDVTAGIDDTAFSVLKSLTEKEKINLEIKQYDFGVFIKKIDTFESTAKKSWIYYVNDKSGDIAADKYKLKNGDKVMWKYEIPK